MSTDIFSAAHCVTIRGVPVSTELLNVVLGKYNLIGGDISAQEREVSIYKLLSYWRQTQLPSKTFFEITVRPFVMLSFGYHGTETLLKIPLKTPCDLCHQQYLINNPTQEYRIKRRCTGFINLFFTCCFSGTRNQSPRELQLQTPWQRHSAIKAEVWSSVQWLHPACLLVGYECL